MEEKFDRALADKIRDELRGHAEKYPPGSWETFLGKKKRKKKLIYWYLSGTAASLLLFFTMYALLEQKDTGTELFTPDTVSSNSPAPIPRREYSGPYAPVEKPRQSLPVPALRDTGPGAHFPDSHREALNGKMASGSTQRKRQEAPGPIAPAGLNLTAKESIPLVFGPSAGITHPGPGTIPENTLEDKEKETQLLTLGLLLSPGYGAHKDEQAAATSSGLGYGVAMEVKFTSNLSVSTGLVFSTQDIAQTEGFADATEGLSSEWEEKTDIGLKVLDVPLYAKYTLPLKDKHFFIAGGISSYYVLRQELTTRTTVTREVLVVESVEGGTQTHTVKESLTFSDSFTTHKNTFYPAGTINLSLGYATPISGRFSLEIAPFYKYPLTSLTENNLKFATGGINLKVVFSGKE